MDVDIDELQARLALFDSFLLRKIKHKKTAGWYVVTGFVILEATMKVYFTYDTLHRKPVTFCRPVEELVDGRFEL